MTDSTTTTETTSPASEQANTPAPAPETTGTEAAVDKVQNDLHQTVSDTAAAAETAKKEGENEVHHGLKHLEDEAKQIFVTIPEEKVKEFLAWVASKL